MLSRRFFSTATATAGYRLKFDPRKILPHEFGHVRVLNNTTRDAQQSNCSAEMAHEHRQEITKLIDACYKPTTLSGQAPGYEQIWGGTVPMFDIWKRGVSPFDSLRQQVAYMPNTPSSMLFRSSAICAMSNLPVDVIDAFVKQSCEAGMNVFTNFDAHNDPRNHKDVAQAVIKHGGHYQAALSWAVYNPDPSIFNVQWAVDFFRECVAMGAHSLYVKDPSGVLTPEMAGCLARQVKEAFPTLPLVFHTHYQTGYGYMAYMEAVKNGANGVECSLGFPDGAGQPFGLTMLRTFEDMGFNTGNPDKAAMNKLSEYCKKMRPLYSQANVMRTPDISVEQSGIAGGQRSILDKELIDAGQPHLIPQVDVLVAKVRAEGGKVCQVTPVADTYAREAMRRLRGGNPDKNFVPGFTGILVGEGGIVQDQVNTTKQVRALFERASQAAQEQIAAGQIKGTAATVMADPESEVLYAMVRAMQTLAAPTIRAQRRAEVAARIKQLESISQDRVLLASLNRKFAQAVAHYESLTEEEKVHAEPVCENTAAKLKQLNAELAKIDQGSAETDSSLPVLSQAEYEVLLRGSDSSAHVQTVLKSIPKAAAFVEQGLMTSSAFAKVLAKAGFLTCPQTDLLSPGLPAARQAIEALEAKELLGLTETPLLKEDLTVLQACYNKAAIPNLFINFLRNYRENPSYWPALYTGHTRAKFVRDPVVAASITSKVPTTSMHTDVQKRIGPDALNSMVSLQREINELRDRLHAQRAAHPVFAAEEKAEPFAFKRRLSQETIKNLKRKVSKLEASLAEKKSATGISHDYMYAVNDLIRNSLAAL